MIGTYLAWTHKSMLTWSLSASPNKENPPDTLSWTDSILIYDRFRLWTYHINSTKGEKTHLTMLLLGEGMLLVGWVSFDHVVVGEGSFDHLTMLLGMIIWPWCWRDHLAILLGSGGIIWPLWCGDHLTMFLGWIILSWWCGDHLTMVVWGIIWPCFFRGSGSHLTMVVWGIVWPCSWVDHLTMMLRVIIWPCFIRGSGSNLTNMLRIIIWPCCLL